MTAPRDALLVDIPADFTVRNDQADGGRVPVVMGGILVGDDDQPGCPGCDEPHTTRYLAAGRWSVWCPHDGTGWRALPHPEPETELPDLLAES